MKSASFQLCMRISMQSTVTSFNSRMLISNCVKSVTRNLFVKSIRRMGSIRPAVPRFGRRPNRFTVLSRGPGAAREARTSIPLRSRPDQEINWNRTSARASFPNDRRVSTPRLREGIVSHTIVKFSSRPTRSGNLPEENDPNS